MAIHKQKDYPIPEIELLEIIVEHGFGGSGGQLPGYEEDEDVIILG